MTTPENAPHAQWTCPRCGKPSTDPPAASRVVAAPDICENDEHLGYGPTHPANWAVPSDTGPSR